MKMTIEQLVPQIVKALKEIPWGERDFWLAQMVVGIVEKEAWLKADGNGNPQYDVALREFGLSEDDWRWLKGKIDGN